MKTEPTTDYTYGYFTTYRTYFEFIVRACSDAYVLLSANSDINQMKYKAYEVRIGIKNMETEISEYGVQSAKRSVGNTPNIFTH